MHGHCYSGLRRLFVPRGTFSEHLVSCLSVWSTDPANHGQGKVHMRCRTSYLHMSIRIYNRLSHQDVYPIVSKRLDQPCMISIQTLLYQLKGGFEMLYLSYEGRIVLVQWRFVVPVNLDRTLVHILYIFSPIMVLLDKRSICPQLLT